jgi:hypothetical protein
MVWRGLDLRLGRVATLQRTFGNQAVSRVLQRLPLEQYVSRLKGAEGADANPHDVSTLLAQLAHDPDVQVGPARTYLDALLSNAQHADVKTAAHSALRTLGNRKSLDVFEGLTNMIARGDKSKEESQAKTALTREKSSATDPPELMLAKCVQKLSEARITINFDVSKMFAGSPRHALPERLGAGEAGRECRQQPGQGLAGHQPRGDELDDERARQAEAPGNPGAHWNRLSVPTRRLGASHRRQGRQGVACAIGGGVHSVRATTVRRVGLRHAPAGVVRPSTASPSSC